MDPSVNSPRWSHPVLLKYLVYTKRSRMCTVFKSRRTANKYHLQVILFLRQNWRKKRRKQKSIQLQNSLGQITLRFVVYNGISKNTGGPSGAASSVKWAQRASYSPSTVCVSPAAGLPEPGATCLYFWGLFSFDFHIRKSMLSPGTLSNWGLTKRPKVVSLPQLFLFLIIKCILNLQDFFFGRRVCVFKMTALWSHVRI